MNDEVLKMAVKAIELERAPAGEWNQATYMDKVVLTGAIVVWERSAWEVAEADCGTTMCLAGQIAHQAGFVPVALRAASGTEVEGNVWACMNPETKEVMSIRRAAEQILGIESWLGYELFEQSSNIDTVDGLKEYITNATGVEFD